MKLTEPAPFVFYRTPLYELQGGEPVRSEERFYLISCDDTDFSYNGWTESEHKRMTAGKWWSVDEIRQSEEESFSKDVVGILERIFEGEIPKEPEELV